MFHKEKNHKIHWLNLVIVFLLGILIASNFFLWVANLNAQKEIEKLKSDDLALAQAINNLLAQTFSEKTPGIPTSPSN